MFNPKHNDESKPDITDSYTSDGNINIPYYESWSQNFINLLKKSVAKYDIEGESKSLVRYLKVNIIDKDDKPLPLAINEEGMLTGEQIIPDEPVSFNSDGNITIDMKTPVRVSGLTSGDTLVINQEFPLYDDIVNAINDFNRIYNLIADACCFGQGPEDIRQELKEQAKAIAAQYMPEEDLTDLIENIDKGHPASASLDNHRTTPHTIAFLAYARKTSSEIYRMPLDELFMEHGQESESNIVSFINTNVRNNEKDLCDLTACLSEKIYNRYESLFSYENQLSM